VIHEDHNIIKDEEVKEKLRKKIHFNVKGTRDRFTIHIFRW